jgi:hypothetical protein
LCCLHRHYVTILLKASFLEDENWCGVCSEDRLNFCFVKWTWVGAISFIWLRSVIIWGSVYDKKKFVLTDRS